MKILLVNDDGVMAHGLHTLGMALAEIADVYVAAPEQEQSGSGHGITVRKPLYAKPLKLTFAREAWSIAGYPADCVKLALEELLREQPHMVVSGINNGANMGNDLLYSGTVSAAMEGFLYGLPAIAVSVSEKPGNYWAAAEFTRDICRRWQQKNFQPHTLLNINVPGKDSGDIKGCRYTNMGWRWYEDVFAQEKDEHGRSYYWLGGRIADTIADSNSDVGADAAGYISLTPLNFDLTDYKVLDLLREEDVDN
ncbi:MAG: 5'/3'-nucleotidase SurE [Clostridiales bacterium]|nr:5'/3'-nucleotidase SurE [Clostridiales bacterium]